MNLDYNYNYTASHVKIAQVAPPGGAPAGGGAPAPALDGAPATRPLAAGGWRSREAATPPGAALAPRGRSPLNLPLMKHVHWIPATRQVCDTGIAANLASRCGDDGALRRSGKNKK